MDFRDATDILFERVTHDELAAVLGVSVASVRQARLDPDAKAFRSPPQKWRLATVRLAEEKIKQYQRMISKLEADAAERSQALKHSVRGSAIPVMRD